MRKTTAQQQAFGKIANFVVNSRLLFARNFIFNRKYSVPNFAHHALLQNFLMEARLPVKTSQSRRVVIGNLKKKVA